MNFVADRVFERQLKKAPADIREKVRERLELLAVDEFNQVFKNHKLHVPFSLYRSINITGDWRLIYCRVSENTINLRAVGTHHQLYGA